MTITEHSTAELFASLDDGLRNWSAARKATHGFGLLGTDAHRERMVQARRLLVAEHVLSTWATVDAPVVLMKGWEVAVLYPQPIDRPFRDVDLLVAEPRAMWDRLRSAEFVQSPTRRLDIDHHHLPPLSDPSVTIGVEVHHRPNVPAWASVPVGLLFETAQPSRTGVPGVLRPRDDLHALLLALHGWKGGFTRLRDLFDAVLLASVSERDVATTANGMGLGRLWSWTCRLVETELFDRRARRGGALVASTLVPRADVALRRTRGRLLAPYLVAAPWGVTAAHLADARLGREARREPISAPGG